MSAIVRRKRSGNISAAETSKALADFRSDLLTRYSVIEISPSLIVRAMSLAEFHALRGYDAVQLAAALELYDEITASGLPAPTLIAADTELNAAAVREGMNVDDPNNH